ncbi:uncharacterized protein LOC108039344 [Drosophila rhopaloa]|uniref:Uncharacterized protein LOC108039344 n=1 Tax=Drosophila rhopaloa TaxID=1041015 RepID=A0A6P4EEN5_DRORH|nr:uncharacterized protein LOC108039344 [Drosophila rhopaloa]
MPDNEAMTLPGEGCQSSYVSLDELQAAGRIAGSSGPSGKRGKEKKGKPSGQLVHLKLNNKTHLPLKVTAIPPEAAPWDTFSPVAGRTRRAAVKPKFVENRVTTQAIPEAADGKKPRTAPWDTFSPVAGRTRRAAVKPKFVENRVTTQAIPEAGDGKKPRTAPWDTFSPVAGRTRRAAVKPKTVEKPQPIESPALPKLVGSKLKQLNVKQSDMENAIPGKKSSQESGATRKLDCAASLMASWSTNEADRLRKKFGWI